MCLMWLIVALRLVLRLFTANMPCARRMSTCGMLVDVRLALVPCISLVVEGSVSAYGCVVWLG